MGVRWVAGRNGPAEENRGGGGGGGRAVGRRVSKGGHYVHNNPGRERERERGRETEREGGREGGRTREEEERENEGMCAKNNEWPIRRVLR